MTNHPNRAKPFFDIGAKHPYHLHFVEASGATHEWRGSNTHSTAYFYYPTLDAATAARDEAYANHDAGKATNFKAPRGRLAVVYFDGSTPCRRVA